MRLFQIDSFTSVPFRGNPAGVCLLEAEPSATWMQGLALEMNLSETAFVWRDTANPSAFQIRFYTPTQEVPLCGHATLASGFVLLHVLRQVEAENNQASNQAILGWAASEPIVFHAPGGRLLCQRQGAGIEMDFPAGVLVSHPFPAADLALLGLTHLSQPPLGSARQGSWVILEVAHESDVRMAKPKMEAMAEQLKINLCITARSTMPQVDIVSRVFAPMAGIPEDPATGFAHTLLAPYWCQRLHKPELTCHQASARGGDLVVGLQGERVKIRGNAVLIFEAHLDRMAKP
jgi:PhzF family phenazine biosynthesis protein